MIYIYNLREPLEERSVLRLLTATNREFAEIRHGIFPFRRDLRLRLWPLPEGAQTREEGLVIRSTADELLAVSFYQVHQGTLLVYDFSGNPPEPKAGCLLAEGLREIAQEKKLESILLTSEYSPRQSDFLKACGFILLAFFASDPHDKHSGEVSVWKLPILEG